MRGGRGRDARRGAIIANDIVGIEIRQLSSSGASGVHDLGIMLVTHLAIEMFLLLLACHCSYIRAASDSAARMT